MLLNVNSNHPKNEHKQQYVRAPCAGEILSKYACELILSKAQLILILQRSMNMIVNTVAEGVSMDDC